jgi:hypothetical protein
MNIELSLENAAALGEIRCLCRVYSSEFLNGYINDNMVALFENPRSGELESHLGNSRRAL